MGEVRELLGVEFRGEVQRTSKNFWEEFGKLFEEVRGTPGEVWGTFGKKVRETSEKFEELRGNF